MAIKPTGQSGGKNMHDGHRKRLFNLACKAGLDALSEVQVMELVLCYIMPRGDVNPLAHRLLDRFGSVIEVIDARPEELKEVSGIGEDSAKKLHMLSEVFLYYSTHQIHRQKAGLSFGDLADLVENLLRIQKVECLYAMAFDKNGKLLGTREMSKGDENLVEMAMSELSLFISSTKAKQIAIAHNHPSGSSLPSGQDKTTCKYIENFCEFLGCIFVDSFIVGIDGVYSMRENRVIRNFKTTI